MLTDVPVENSCFHCGDSLDASTVRLEDKSFCCIGCKTVYQVLQQHGLCAYYERESAPGISQRLPVRKDKFAFLDNTSIQEQLITFSGDDKMQVELYLPQMHCSSCLWLLEQLPNTAPGILQSRVDFAKKELTVLFHPQVISLRVVVELLASLGYEPHISLHDLEKKPEHMFQRRRLYRLAVAGFCFGNIMLLSFPEYLGMRQVSGQFDFMPYFRWLSLMLSIPVIFYSAAEFFSGGWAGLRNRYLNIDAPIALAILITFLRSVFEIISGSGSGYLDSMSGIVFFMLIGRMLQDRTHQSLSFQRDYTSYFPVAVNKLTDGTESPVSLNDLRSGDHIVIHANEIVPADGMLVRGEAAIDYSFVTGESIPVEKQISEMIYAGGRQTSGRMELLLVRDVRQSYLTGLWNKASMQTRESDTPSWVHAVSRYFTVVLFTLTAIAGIYWFMHDAEKVWPAVTAALIVACPCALLLSHTFTNGHVISLFDQAGCYVRDAGVVEALMRVNHIVFDKTGTLTDSQKMEVNYSGQPVTAEWRTALASLAASSGHPLSRAVLRYLHVKPLPVQHMKEHPGRGVEAWINEHHIKLGSLGFTGGHADRLLPATVVAWSLDGVQQGIFMLRQHYRSGLRGMMKKLTGRFKISVLSGDNDSEAQHIRQLVGKPDDIRFEQSPSDKLAYIEQLKINGNNVLMVGDGLNDAGALKAAHVGIAVTDNINQFSPGCDVIMEAGRISQLHQYLRLARRAKQVVVVAFIISLIYNVIGLTYAFQAALHPMIAAILMPSSTISIIFITWLGIRSGKHLLAPPNDAAAHT